MRDRIGTVRLASSSMGGGALGGMPTPNLIAELIRRGAVEHRALGNLIEGDRVLVIASHRGPHHDAATPETVDDGDTPSDPPAGAGKRQA